MLHVLILLPLVLSEPSCNMDPNCAFYPNVTIQCRDELNVCNMLPPRLCTLYKHATKLLCAYSCSFCEEVDDDCICSSEWTSWDECNRPCGGGERFRNRNCDRTSSCKSATRQAQSCNTGSCAADPHSTCPSYRWSARAPACELTNSTCCPFGRRVPELVTVVHNGDTATAGRRIDPAALSSIEIATLRVAHQVFQGSIEATCPSCPLIADDETIIVSKCSEKSLPCLRNEGVHRYNSSSSCCLPSLSVTCGIFNTENSIIGGERAKPSEFPWTLLLLIQTSNFNSACGAVLINDQWALTAAHCVKPYSIHQLTILAGTQNLNEPGEQLSIKTVVVHPSYDMPLADIALIQFFFPLDIASASNPSAPLRPICLPRGEVTPEDADCYAAGWGATHPTLHRISSTLNVVRLRNLDLQSCITAHRRLRFGKMVDRSMLCAGVHAGGVDTCSGDSGGPLMCQRCSTCSWYLAGITSFGPTPCARAGFPGVYTKILEHELWIDATIETEQFEHPFKYEDTC